MKRVLRTRWIFLLSSVLLVLPLLLRVLAGSPLIPGAESYAWLQSSDSYGVLIGYLGEWSILFSPVLGLLSVFLFHKLTPRFARRKQTRQLALLLFVINPVFLGVFTRLNPYTIAIPIGLALLLTRRRVYHLPLELLLALVAPHLALLLLPALFTKERRTMVLPLLLAAALTAIQGWPFHDFAPHLVEFGLPGGISILFLALALIELVRQWNRKQHRVLLTWFVLLILLTPWNESACVLAGLVSTPLAALIVARLYRRKWTIKEAKPLALLLLACAFLFLVITNISMTVQDQPSAELLLVLDALPDEPRVVLAPAAMTPLLKHFTQGQAIIDSCRDTPRVCHDVEELYQTRKLEPAASLLERYNIRYLLITQEMREGGVWKHDEDGLLFLLKHSNSFELVASSSDEELWHYRQNFY